MHPHFVSSDSIALLPKLETLLQSQNCVALGEVGLNYTGGCGLCLPTCTSNTGCLASKKAAQLQFLRMALPLCQKYDKALIAHCRDAGSGEASNDFLKCLLDLELSHLLIHRHCFTGSTSEMLVWLSRCPNVKFGFTSTLLRNPQTQQAVCELELERILFKSDAPYLPVSGQSRDAITPWYTCYLFCKS